LFGVLWGASPEFKSRVEKAVAGDVRMKIWPDTVDMIESKPVLGHGPGTYYYYISEFRVKYENAKNYVRYAHNEYLHVLAEYGIAGFLLFFGITTYVLVRFMIVFMRCQSRRDGNLIAGIVGVVVGSLVHALFDFNFHIFANVHMLVFFTAITVAALGGTDWFVREEKPSVAYRWISIPVAVICLVASFAAIQWTAISWLDRKINKLVYSDVDDVTYTASLKRLCNRSLKIDPGYTVPYRFLADDLRAFAYWNIEKDPKAELADEALAVYQKALPGNVRDPDVLYGMAKCYEIKGELEKASRLYAELVRQNPTRIYYRLQYGLFLKEKGDTAEAVKVFKAAQKLDPDNPAIKVNIRILSRKLLDNSFK
jgi:tetratricopeptide (TPR) repeat protein